MRILFIVEHFPCLSETFVLNQVTGLLDLGHEVTVYAVGQPVAPVVHPDVETYQLMEKVWNGPGMPVSKILRIAGLIKRFPKLFSRCRMRGLNLLNPIRYGRQAGNLYLFHVALPLLNHDTRFDAIHCHFGDKGNLALALKEAGVIDGPISIVFHAHELAGLSDKKGKALFSRLFQSRELLLPISKRWAERLIRWGADPKRVVVHHMGVDIARFRYSPVIPEPGASVRILSVGRLTEQKGYEYALRAVQQLREWLDVPLEYLIIGMGELEDPLIALVRDLGIEDCVTFEGAQSHDVVMEKLHKAHIFLLPSVTASNGYQEGIPVALMEAMASGTAVVSTFHSGIPELVEDGVSGCLAQEKDVECLIAAMQRLLVETAEYQGFVDAGREKVAAEFNLDSLNRCLADLFEMEMLRNGE